MDTTTKPPSASQQQRAQAGTSTLITAFITLLIIGTDLFVISPLLPDIADHFDITPSAAGRSVTVFSLAYMLGAPLAGGLADRLGRRLVLVAGLAGFAAANLLTALAPWFTLLLVARMFAGIAASAITPSILALVGQSAPDGRRGTWMSTAMAGFLISLTTGAPTGIALASILGWRSVFMAIAVLACLFAFINAFSWSMAAGATAHGPASHDLSGGPSLATKLRAVSVTAIWAFAVYACYTYLGTALSDTAHLSDGQIEAALVIYGIAAVIGSLGGGRLADRFGAGRVATLSLVSLGAAALLIGLTLQSGTLALFVTLGLFALVAYPCLPSYQSRLVATFGRHSGSVLAWNSCFMYLGTSLGAAAGGWLLSASGFRLITVVGAATAIVGAIVYQTVALPKTPSV